MTTIRTTQNVTRTENDENTCQNKQKMQAKVGSKEKWDKI